MGEKEFIEKLEGYRRGLNLIETTFPGKFTEYEKMTIVLRMESSVRLKTIGDHLDHKCDRPTDEKYDAWAARSANRLNPRAKHE